MVRPLTAMRGNGEFFDTYPVEDDLMKTRKV